MNINDGKEHEIKNFKRNNYFEKLKDPRWQKKRLEIMQRDEFTCQICHNTEKTLNVHHRIYRVNSEPWDYENDVLVTLCEDCHELEKNYLNESISCLSTIIKSTFFSHEILSLCYAFIGLKMVHIPSVIVSALEHNLTDYDSMKSIVDNYFSHLKKEYEKKNGEKENA